MFHFNHCFLLTIDINKLLFLFLWTYKANISKVRVHAICIMFVKLKRVNRENVSLKLRYWTQSSYICQLLYPHARLYIDLCSTFAFVVYVIWLLFWWDFPVCFHFTTQNIKHIVLCTLSTQIVAGKRHFLFPYFTFTLPQVLPFSFLRLFLFKQLIEPILLQ